MADKKIQVLLLVKDEAATLIQRAVLQGKVFIVVAVDERKSVLQHDQSLKPADGANNSDGDLAPKGNPHRDEVYEGTVKLLVRPGDLVRKMVHFVDELRQNPGFRLLLLEARQQDEEVTIWLGLREPTAMVLVLLDMEDVLQVETPNEPSDTVGENVIEVILAPIEQ